MVDIKLYKKSKEGKSSKVIATGASSNQGGSSSSHTHANKNALDAISIDSEGYEYLTQQKEVVNDGIGVPTTQVVREKVKAGYADKAGSAEEADHAKRADVAYDLSEDSPANERFVRKDRPDTTPYSINAKQGFTAGNFVAGASGGHVDGRGNAEVESIVVRSFMKVFELVYNRLNALEGNTSFADSGTIESITHDGGYNYTAVMRPRWEGDFTSFQVGDVVYGYVNDLRKETPDGYVPTDDNGDEDPAAQGYVYYKAWAYVSEVADRENGILKLVRYADGDDVPGKRNFPMRDGMLISRWGNNTPANEFTANDERYSSFIIKKGTEENPIYVNTRQQSFYISCDDGNIVELYGVTKPVLDETNYGTVLGQLPGGLADKLGISNYINPGQPYLYARGVIVQDLIRISYQGTKILAPYFRGEWSKKTAESDTDYYRMADDSEDWVTYQGALYHYISTERTTLNPEEDGGAHWGRITGTLKPIWQIVPSVDKINIRDNGWSDKTLEVVVRATEVSGVTDITTPEALDAYGKELVFSLDGVSYNEFWVRQGEQIDGLGLDHSGNNIPWMEVTERILLTLRNKDTHDEAMTVSVPVIKDGSDGESIKGDKGDSGTSAVNRYRVFTGYPETYEVEATYQSNYTDAEMTANGWLTTYGAVDFGNSLWQTSATRDGNGDIIGGWSAPVMLTGKPGEAGRAGLMPYPAGNFDKLVTYRSDGVTTPIVMDGVDGQGKGQYYMLKPGLVYCGDKLESPHKSPSEDVTYGDSEYWTWADRFTLIFADVVMADFAKLASAVFHGNRMFSQYGHDADGNILQDEGDYRNIDNGFIPNLLINFLSGELQCDKATITGIINADSGRIGNLMIEGNSLVGYNDKNEQVLKLGIGEVDVEDTSTTLGVPASFYPTPNRPSATCHDQSAYWSEASIDAWRDYRDGDFLDEQMDLYATLKFKLNEAAETLNIDRFGHGYSTTSGRYNGRVVCTASLAKVANGTRTPIGSSWDASNNATFSNLTAGDYEIDVVVSLMPDGGSSEWSGTIYVDNGIITATTMRTDLGNRVELAKNGFLCRQGASKYLQFSKQSGFEVRFGDFGLKIDSEGIKGIKDKEWKKINLQYS